MIDQLRHEIEDVHAFISAWFRGDVAQDEALFDARLCRRLDAGMVNIQPSGQVLTRSDLINGLRAGYASNANFQIEIGNVEVRFADGDFALVTYVEFQRGAKNTVPADNRRVSSVLFRGVQAGSAPVWLHIHETGLD